MAELNTLTSPNSQSVTVNIAENTSASRSTVASGGVDFDGLTVGTTSVSATIPGLIATDAASQDVTVTVPGITLSSLPTTVGSGLQRGFLRARLGASQHGGVTMRIESSDPLVALVSPDATTPGTAFIELDLPNGGLNFDYYIQGLEGVTGSIIVTASADGFNDGTGTVNVVPSGIRINSLASSIGSGAIDDPFIIQTGIPNTGGTNLSIIQPVRAGNGGLIVAIGNGVSTVGQLVTTTATGQNVTVTIAENSNRSPTTVAAGGVAFDPLTPGTTSVLATAPQTISTDAADQSVTVN